MKRLTVGVAVLVALASVALAGPDVITYQGYVVGPGGAPAADNMYDMRFELYDA
ncbi:hypothetical protein FJY63_13025, partial [Candidatus Sumerlaeota bacterium]|nr:hypothetical protein [Candidatus Sumerlaeota bacterium]